MELVFVVDDHGGIEFNSRRQSRDRGLIRDLAEVAGSKPICCLPYSEMLFEKAGVPVKVSPVFPGDSRPDSVWFLEKTDLSSFSDAEMVILYCWNRSYPFDKILSFDFSEYELESEFEFTGSSHKGITRKIYRKRK